MPNNCCVTNCRSNYEPPYVTVYCFPADDERRRLWMLKIPHDNLIVTQHSRLCIKHFEDKFIIRYKEFVDAKTRATCRIPLDVPRYSLDAIPTVFPNLPSYFRISWVFHKDCHVCRWSQLEIILPCDANDIENVTDNIGYACIGFCLEQLRLCYVNSSQLRYSSNLVSLRS